MPNTEIVLVAAVGENNVIGNEGRLPWRLRSDLAHFKKLTINRPVVMGRKTFDSIGKALKDRTNIVVSRDLSLKVPGGVLATGMQTALDMARADAKKRGVNEIMIIGGSDLFAAFMPMAARLEVTRVHARPEGDSFFPEIDPAVWQEVWRKEQPRGPNDEYDFTLLTYKRIAGKPAA